MKKEKIFDRIRNNPKAVRFEELKKVLTDVGFEERQPKGGSSHYIYCHVSLDRIVVLTRKPGILHLSQKVVYTFRKHEFGQSYSVGNN